MKKLALKMDDLRVDSFNTVARDASVRGTVRGNEDSVYYCPSQSCPTQFGNTCNGTCGGATCGGQICIPLDNNWNF